MQMLNVGTCFHQSTSRNTLQQVVLCLCHELIIELSDVAKSTLNVL